ncbi:hypothetical protein F4553_001624 [Allocatelliglobosispora scoriae]|uniref:Asl1-like glycosyl hydrolase catalytic domain-containing protein n=1 Tax=Allocatelliglobosispora scoriae TaxID=643052 RepID=A0A841BKS7_9ACTN|nr:glycoside hydrolase family protein [Allocatelliglobosispora scoriae]MBB5868245.1 hypothetical protein [Allocatelliglobosispora scoriae]
MDDTTWHGPGKHERPRGRRAWWLVALLVIAVLAGATVLTTRLLTDRPSPTALPAPVDAPTADGTPSGPPPTAAGSATQAPSASAVPRSSASASASAKASPPAPRPPGRATPKKGVSVWDFPGIGQALADVRASWYYNWSSGPSRNAGSSAKFVPMIWGPKSVTDSELARAKANGSVLLGFNEPDFASQSNMTVEKALELWPRLQATGMRLGSPAVAVGGDRAGGWLDRFISGARSKGLRVDFITLHWYGSDFSDAAAGQLKGYLQAVYNRYRLPIWVTEYALIRWGGGGAAFPSDAQQASFATKSTAMMESLSYVERYAWFALPTPTEGGQGTGLYRNGTTPTAAGRAYRAAG